MSEFMNCYRKWWYRVFLLLDAPLLGIFVGLVATIAINLFTNPSFEISLIYYDSAIFLCFITIFLLVWMIRVRTEFDTAISIRNHDNEKMKNENIKSSHKVPVETHHELINNALDNIYLIKKNNKTRSTVSNYWFCGLFLPLVVFLISSIILIYIGHKDLNQPVKENIHTEISLNQFFE